jgi:hypothetical protein
VAIVSVGNLYLYIGLYSVVSRIFAVSLLLSIGALGIALLVVPIVLANLYTIVVEACLEEFRVDGESLASNLVLYCASREAND